MRIRILPVVLILATTLGASLSCNRGPSEEQKKLAAFGEKIAAVNQSYGKLQQVRAAEADAKSTIAEIEAVAERKRTDDQKAQLEELTAKVKDLAAQDEEGYNDLQSQLADALNIGLNEFPQAPETAQALKIYSDEAIVGAVDLINKSGDYKKAIERLASAKGYYDAIELTPDPALTDKIAEFEDWRYITQERFDAVKNGMTKDEVKATVGVPYTPNIKTEESRGVEMWLFKKREGGAAAVDFRIKTGKVYSKRWDAVSTKVVKD